MINFRQYPAMTKATIPNNIRLSSGNFSNSFYNMRNLVVSNFNHNDVTNILYAYRNCYNLTSSPVCGEKVTDMHYTYCNCYNLTGSPVCGNNVTDMYSTYEYCRNITGSPICGNNVTTMGRAYYDCYSLTGSPICGEKVTNMYYTYRNCRNLANIGYFYSPNVTNVKNCFYNWSTRKQLSLYVLENSTTLNTCLITNTNSLVGKNITWTTVNYSDGNIYYYCNSAYNIYIYPVTNVKEAYYSIEYDTLLVPTSYNDNFIDTVTMKPKTCWTYNAIEETIDNGYLMSTIINTEQLTNITINQVEVTV